MALFPNVTEIYFERFQSSPVAGALGRVAGIGPQGSAAAGAEVDPQGSLLFRGVTEAEALGRPQGSTGAGGLGVAPGRYTQMC